MKRTDRLGNPNYWHVSMLNKWGAFINDAEIALKNHVSKENTLLVLESLLELDQ